jgi:hypothetical protein
MFLLNILKSKTKLRWYDIAKQLNNHFNYNERTGKQVRER